MKSKVTITTPNLETLKIVQIGSRVEIHIIVSNYITFSIRTPNIPTPNIRHSSSIAFTNVCYRVAGFARIRSKKGINDCATANLFKSARFK